MLSGDTFTTILSCSSSSFFRKDYNLANQVNDLVGQLRDMGLIGKFMTDSLDNRCYNIRYLVVQVCFVRLFLAQPEASSLRSLGLEVYFGPLIIWSLGLFVGTITFCLEAYIGRKPKDSNRVIINIKSENNSGRNSCSSSTDTCKSKVFDTGLFFVDLTDGSSIS